MDAPTKTIPDPLPPVDLSGLRVIVEAYSVYKSDFKAMQGTILWPVSLCEVMIVDDDGKAHRVGMHRMSFVSMSDLMDRVANAKSEPAMTQDEFMSATGKTPESYLQDFQDDSLDAMLWRHRAQALVRS